MSGVEFVCSVCQKKYKLKHYYEKHLLQHQQGSVTAKVVKEESTKVNKEVLSCPYCGKEYKTSKGLAKHELIHVQAAAGNEVLPVSNGINPLREEEAEDTEIWPESAEVAEEGLEEIISFFEEEDEHQEAQLLLEMGIITTTPNVPAAAAGNVPTAMSAKIVKTPIALCHFCGRGFLSMEGLIKHLMSHSMEDSLSRAPSLEAINTKMERISTEVLQEIIGSYEGSTRRLEKQVLKCATKLSEVIDSENSKAFLSSLTEGLYACFALGSKFLLPSHLREAYLKGSAILLANKEKKEELHVKLLSALNFEELESDLNFFLTTFMRKYSLKLLAFIVHWMMHGEDSPIVQSEKLYIETKQALDTVDFKQTLHYTAGANVKSVLRNAWRKWAGHDDAKAVINTLRENFLVNELKEAPEKEFMEWTLSQDRGKLIIINGLALSFFFELATIVKPLEHLDGSLYVDEVIEKCALYPKIMYLWEELVNDSLPKKLQFKLLHSLCTYFCNTWRSGIVSRRRDELHSSKQGQTLGTAGVAFRAKVVKHSQK